MGKAARVTSWTLYLDESGDFSDSDDPIAVAGLLLHDDVDYSPVVLREALERAVPWCPWPLHASHINQAAYVALAWHDRFGGSPPAGDNSLAGAAREAVARMAVAEPASVELLLAAIRDRTKPDVQALRRLTGRLRSDYPRILRSLEAGSLEAWTQVRAVARRLGGDGASAFLAAASETEKGDAGNTADQRYFQRLEALLDRVAAALRRLSGHHRVGVRALARDVLDLRVNRRMRLMPQHVGETIRKIPSDVYGSVRLVAEEVADYDEHVSIPFILADFFANRARRALRRESSSLLSTEEELVGDLGLGLRSGDPGRTHLAATGDGLRFIRTPPADAGVSARDQLPWVPPRRRWAVEQAWEWSARV